ncbi:MAG TPA: FAD-dependent oxidoreductase [Casimicrobiaceae bacterium]|nr:FAD-dependent oxidoreductase [Casimicrobiaceae bacterium]
MEEHVAIVGAGVVGLACASYLQMRGHPVTLIDPRPPGEYCSFGNAGCFSRSSFVPLGLPGMWKKVPAWLLDPAGPLHIPMRYVPRIAPWLWQFQRASAMPRVEAIAGALHGLLAVTLDKWRPLAARAGVPELIVQHGYAFAYESEKAFNGDALGRDIRRRHGVVLEVLSGPAIREFEPTLSRRVTHLVRLPEQGHCPNPLRLSRALAARLREGDATFVTANATGFDVADGKVVRVLTNADPIAVDVVVIAAGVHSNALSKQLGADVPLETERGYHVTLTAPSIAPHVPIASAEDKYFATPMEEGLRIAGTVELAGLDAPPDFARADALLEKAQRLLPGLRGASVSRWMGHRPSLPDSMPVIGRALRASNAWLAFGHGHVGLTGAAPTGEIIADLISGRTPFLDIRPFSAERFRRAAVPFNESGATALARTRPKSHSRPRELP